MIDEIEIDLQKYKKMYVRKTIMYLFIYPIILVFILLGLAIIIGKLGLDVDPIGMAAVFISLIVLLNAIITWWAFYFGYKNTYKSTKFVLEGDNILYIRLKERDLSSGGVFYYHNIQSVNNYTITDNKIIVKGNILKRKVDEQRPDDRFIERVSEGFSVPNVFGNVQLLEKVLKNKKQEVVS